MADPIAAPRRCRSAPVGRRCAARLAACWARAARSRAIRSQSSHIRLMRSLNRNSLRHEAAIRLPPSLRTYAWRFKVMMRAQASRLNHRALFMTTKTGFDTLMHQVCVGWGHCGSLQAGKYSHVTDFIPDSGTVTATQFAEWVLLAEGEADAPPSYRERWLPRLRASFVEHMGADSVDARRLRWQSD